MELKITIEQEELIKALMKSNPGLKLAEARRFVLRHCEISNNKLITLTMTFHTEEE